MYSVEWLLIIFVIIFVILVIFYNLLVWSEEKILFYPTHKVVWTPDCDYQELWLDPQDVKGCGKGKAIWYEEDKERCKSYIHLWHFNQFKGRKTVIFCHGNSGNLSHRKYIWDICKQFRLNLVLFDYRGFGQSSGVPSKCNVKKDGEAVYRWVHSFTKSKNIIIWGESLGGAAACHIASKYCCRALLLLSTFSSLDDALVYNCEGYSDKKRNKGEYQGDVKQQRNMMSSVVAKLAKLKLDMLSNKELLKCVKCPVAIMHSVEDDMISYQCAKINYTSISHQSKILIPVKGGHSSPKINKEELNRLFMFCDIALPSYKNTVDVSGMLYELETVANKHNLFMED